MKNLKISPFLKIASTVALSGVVCLWSLPAFAEIFLNLGNSQFQNHCLNVRGDNGAVTVESRPHTGCNWSIIPKGNGRYQIANLGNSKYNGWLLNVRGDNGRVTVERGEYSGTYWTLAPKGNDRYQMVNLGNSPYKGWVLNVAGNTGTVTVMPSTPEYSGTFWKISRWAY